MSQHEHDGGEVELRDWPKMRLATDEELEEFYGSGVVFLGPVVRPKREPEQQEDVADSDDEQPKRD